MRITFDSSPLVGLPAGEVEALEALRQLSHLPEVEALDTHAGPLPRLKTGPVGANGEFVEARVEYGDGTERRATVSGLPQLRGVAATFVGRTDAKESDPDAVLGELVTAQAHSVLNRDILVTLSPTLLTHRVKTPLREANPRAPSEAAKVVGLFLRSRDNYTYAVEGAPVTLDRGLFYSALAWHRLPNMWCYCDACGQAGAVRGDDTSGLGRSVLVRCVRALQARDAIGAQFYVPQGNNSRDAMMYHFDYLTLVLAGAIDAQARVAHRAYRMTKPKKESYASFHRQEMKDELKECGALALHKLAIRQYFEDVMTLLRQPRNTIHGASWDTLAYHSGAEPEASFVDVPLEYSQPLLDAAGRTGSPQKWGLTSDPKVLLEPYTYSVALVDESFKLIDEIASATDTARLFPTGHPIPTISTAPPEDGVFAKHIRSRLDVLG